MAKKKEVKKESGFELTIENSRILKTVVETLASIIDETEIIVTPKEFMIRAMDPSRICLLQVIMEKKDWDKYNCKSKQNLGINLEDLDKIMKRASLKDTITLSFIPEEEKLKIKMRREGDNRIRVFSLSSLKLELEDIPLENLLNIDYSTIFAINVSILEEALKDAEIYSEIFTIKSLKDEGINFSSVGIIGEMLYELGSDELEELNIIKDSTESYNVKFLISILKLKGITEKLEVSLKTDNPAKLVFNITDGGIAHFFLAPRVEEVEFDESEVELIEEEV
nr:MAG: proliferating cellular nuclear antigen [uncultured archaeon]